MTIEEHHLHIDGLGVNCRAAGPTDGLPVVLLHGWGASWHYWQWALPALAAAGFRAYAPDLIGHGDTDKPPLAYGGDDYLGFLTRLTDYLELDQAILGGHSLGGYIALRYALEHPDRVRKLVLISPLYQRDQLPVPRRILPVVTGPLRTIWRFTPAQFVALAARAVRDSDQGVLPASFTRRMILDYKQATPRIAASIVEFRDLTPDLSRITAPALVFWGGRDLLATGSFPPLVAALPHAQACEVPAAAHAAHVETLVPFHDAMFTFVIPSQPGLALPLHGPRVAIRPHEPADIGRRAQWRPFTDPLYRLWAPATLPAVQLDNFYRQRRQDPTRHYYAIDDERGQLIGDLSLREIRVGRQARLGITIGADWVSQGYGTEALRAFIPYYFTILRFQELHLDVAASNIRAVRCYEKLGFQRAAEFYRPVAADADLSFLADERYALLRRLFVRQGSTTQALFYEMTLTPHTFVP
jgi:pimeloyl-ACP methyl ester carboxylesterase/RimJ/RimL family protein N-acetyltransferase